MPNYEEFDDEQEAMNRVKWLVDNQYKASIWWEITEQGKVWRISSYSMI